MDIKELNKELDGYKAQLDSARILQLELHLREDELLTIIKEEMKKRGINVVKIDLDAEIGDKVDYEDWNLMTIYQDEERREWASTVYLDNNDCLQFVDCFDSDGIYESVVTPYCEDPETPAIIFSVGLIDLDIAYPHNLYGDFCGYDIITDDCDPYLNGVIHLAAVFGKCMEIFDKEVSGKA